MSNLKTLSDSLQNAVTSADAQFPDLSRIRTEAGLPSDRMGYRFYRVKEITEGKAEQYRMAMANVLSNLANKENAIIYILSGKPEGIDLFIGVAGKRGNDVADDAKMLKQSFEGNFLGAVLENVKDDGGFPALFAKAGNVGIVTGVTGAGKTTTCMKLLLETGFPFTVIEPAKTEYRALNRQVEGVQYYSLGREDLTTFRLNPFELVSKHQNLTGHISMLKATMAAVFPMEASMPFIIETAIIRSYQLKGWDIANNTNYLVDDPWNTEESVWPTFSEMIAELDNVIKAAGMGKEFEEKYRGSLVSRLESLTKGIRGTMINTPRSLDFDKLLDRKVVIELDELKDEEDKAFFMGLIIGRLAECMKQRHRTDNRFRHITLVEEAHRLLSKPEPGADGSKKLGVEMFANLLAEVRKYGECLVIADQIPNKLVSDVLKNTNTKIIHRLFAADDRSSIGDTMSLNDEQKDFLPLLAPGETVIYSGGWHAPVRAQIDQLVNTVAEEIEEGEIQKIGQEQLWLQSERLFPSVRRLNLLHTPEAFARAVSYARRLANMLVSVAQLADGNGRFYEPGKTMAQKIAGRLAVQIAEMRQETALDRQTTAQLIAAVMKDAQPTGILNGQKNFAQLQTALDTLIGILETDASSLTDRIAPDSKLRNAVTGTLGKCSLI